MTQNLLDFDSPPAQRHSPTSRAAAESIVPGIGEQTLLTWLREHGPATDLEMQDALGWRGDYQRPRRVKLTQLGLVKDSGRTRETSSGRQATVWEARA